MGTFLCSRDRGGFYLLGENKSLGKGRQWSVSCVRARVCVHVWPLLVLSAACLLSVHLHACQPACMCSWKCFLASFLVLDVYMSDCRIVFTCMCLPLVIHVALCLFVCVICICPCIPRDDWTHVCLSLHGVHVRTQVFLWLCRGWEWTVSPCSWCLHGGVWTCGSARQGDDLFCHPPWPTRSGLASWPSCLCPSPGFSVSQPNLWKGLRIWVRGMVSGIRDLLEGSSTYPTSLLLHLL